MDGRIVLLEIPYKMYSTNLCYQTTGYHFNIADYTDCILQFRENVKDVLQPEHDDHYLLRWLRARNFDLKKSEDMLRKHLVWRKEEDIDNILRQKVPEVIQNYYPGGHCGFDKDGSPVWIDPIGNIDPKGLLRSAKKKDVIYKEIKNAEYVQELMKLQTKKLGKRVDQIIIIYDLENFGMKHLWKPGMDTVVKFLEMFEDNYPEALKIAFIINAPRFFPVVYKLIRPILSEDTVNKIRIFGTNYKSELLKCIDADQLPVYWGGSLIDKDGDPKCPSKIILGGEIPKEYYLKIASEEMENFTTVNVKRGSSLQVDVDVKAAGSCIRWQFTTEGYDLGFGVYKKTKDEKQHAGKMIPVVHSERVDSHLVPEDGSVAVKEAGAYVVRFDNTYSYIRSKTISYLIEVLEPEVEEVNAHTYDKTNDKGDKSELCIDSTLDVDDGDSETKEADGQSTNM
ncbi:SEC14-like protein 2 isoform X1 [Mytilus californianus]|uniref:SEC14-like protein 2 isoform X1 n=1 Tax=Mytilus californianus TaxID=6549 RepID=UPI0022477A04|nr:SEC14-like protein 2 isoform X1 [Mytilus californianus]